MVDQNEPAPGGGGWRGTPPDPAQGDNPTIPAGYTYLGQFVDHDLTFDPASSLQRSNDPDGLHNFRTPRFDLDSVYGEGPADEPFLFDQGEGAEGRMLVDAATNPGQVDLPRNAQGTALTGDPRNDENVVVGQLQVLFLRAHNRLVEGGMSFEDARRELRWHYQWVVVRDFLPRIIGPELVGTLLPQDDGLARAELDFYGWDNEPFMPVEFSVAAYRFGHSMVRPIYDLNATITDKPIFNAGGQAGDGSDLRGFQPLLAGWGIDWSLFFEISGDRPQASRLLDTKLAQGLATLPFSPDRPSLAERNLVRGLRMGLPSGEAVARRMGLEPLTAEQLNLTRLGVDPSVAEAFEGNTPLWFYVLQEATVVGGGQRLGPVGGRIVGETLVGLLSGDPFSFLNVDPSWTPARAPQIPQQDDIFAMADLARFASGS